MARRSNAQEREQAWVAVLMAWIAGGVDAVGYLSLAHLFTAHMSGNSAALGADAGQGAWREGARRAFPIPLFVVGVGTGALLVEGALRRGARSPLITAFVVEGALLLACLLWGRAHPEPTPSSGVSFGLTALPALAMGVQNATLRRVGKTGVRTTYMTGMLTDFAEEAAACGLWLRDRTRGRGMHRLRLALRVASRRDGARKMGLFGGIWLAFLVGAVGGSVAQGRWHWGAMALPLAGLAAVLAALAVRPIAAVSGMEEGAKRA